MAGEDDDLDDIGPNDVEADEVDPNTKERSATAWLSAIEQAEKYFKQYQDQADKIDKEYADLSRLAGDDRDREFQMFWANIQVLGPSVYSRPPVPVVVPRFKDRKPLVRVASELLERTSIVTFELADIDSVMREVRDDLTVQARGCGWFRYETTGKGKDFKERVCIDHKDRRDFLHQPARSWKEVDWVDSISYLTKREMRKRFKKHSADAYQSAAYEDRKDDETDDGQIKARVHEIWCKSKDEVIWVAEGCDVQLDYGKPHLKLEGFFPCPRPVYSTVQRKSLIPVPDMLFYRDQLDEIHELTARIAALTESVKVRGFYPGGAADVTEAIEAAMKAVDNEQVLIRINNWAATGNQALKDMIVWLPLDMIVSTIKQLVEARRELIDVVYQITGLSDIMRGSTVASETLGAQQLKSQYGSIRIRDRQEELVRFARDIERIAAEIIAENFRTKTLLDMSQLEIPSDADIAKQIKPLEDQIRGIIKQVEQAKASPQLQQQAQQNPQGAQQLLDQAKQQAEGLKGQIDKLKDVPTIEKVADLLRDQRLRPFVLDIETDSTIAPDENAAKQRVTEYVTAVGGFMGQAIPLVQAVPQSASMVVDVLKLAASQFRAGREVEGSLEEFADQMKAMAGQPKPEDPAAVKAKADAAKLQVDQQIAAADAAERAATAQKALAETQSKVADDDLARRAKEQQEFDAAETRRIEREGKQALGALQLDQAKQKHAQDMDIGALQLEELSLKIDGLKVKTGGELEKIDAEIDQTNVETDSTIRKTDASIDAAAASAAIKADAAPQNWATR